MPRIPCALFIALSVLSVWLPVLTGAASAQTPSNKVSDCTLIVDPTALRLCVESARHTRPVGTFDPTAAAANTPGSTAADLLPSYGNHPARGPKGGEGQGPMRLRGSTPPAQPASPKAAGQIP